MWLVSPPKRHPWWCCRFVCDFSRILKKPNADGIDCAISLTQCLSCYVPACGMLAYALLWHRNVSTNAADFFFHGVSFFMCKILGKFKKEAMQAMFCQSNRLFSLVSFSEKRAVRRPRAWGDPPGGWSWTHPPGVFQVKKKHGWERLGHKRPPRGTPLPTYRSASTWLCRCSRVLLDRTTVGPRCGDPGGFE